MRVGFIGVGSMGRPMLERIVAAGHDTSFYARRAEVVADAELTGARAVATVAELGAGSDLVVVCVFTDDQVHEVCVGDGGLLGALPNGAVIVIHTTCSPKTPMALEEIGAPRGVRILDAAFSGGPDDAAAGTITLLVGGPADVLEQARPVLGSYSDPIIPVGALGDGQRVKLLNNALFGASVGLAVEAERVARQLGIDPTTAFQAISHCSGNSYALGVAVAMGSAESMMEAAGKYIRKDVATAQQLAAEAGADLGVLAVAAGTTED